MNFVGTIASRSILFIMGENAHSRYVTEDIFDMVGEPGELVVVSGARHIDLYDRVDMIPFDRLNAFFSKALK
ncbi:hypothetical protein [Pseudodesulfovibrio tunisiensis]|uniref:hypothetical protein n=1 Tax=Pseudodesulfovibrio tunisiensis TaxID=463192 RepID=UPI001FB26645|nr:hypothetical protein [Pseudodesulfovibrio tunisiensis]